MQPCYDGLELVVRVDLYKLPIFSLPTGDTTKSADDREVKEEEEEEEEE
jgi:hypothetical protein